LSSRGGEPRIAEEREDWGFRGGEILGWQRRKSLV
jgi:hypothetical protein